MVVKLCKFCGQVPRYLYEHMKDNHFEELDKGIKELGKMEATVTITPKQKYVSLPKEIRNKLDSFYGEIDAKDISAITCITCNKYTEDDNDAIDCLREQHEIIPILRSKK